MLENNSALGIQVPNRVVRFLELRQVGTSRAAALEQYLRERILSAVHGGRRRMIQSREPAAPVSAIGTLTSPSRARTWLQEADR